MADCLELLREHTIKGYDIQIDGDEIVLTGSKGGSEGTQTRFKKTQETKYQSKTNKKVYDLYAVYMCLKHSDLTFRDYMKICRAEKVTMVSTVDKKDLVAYVRGEIDTTPQLRSMSDVGATDSSAAAGSTAEAHPKAAVADRKRKAEDERKPEDRKKQARSSSKTPGPMPRQPAPTQIFMPPGTD